MTHKSDEETNTKFVKLRDMEAILSGYINQIRLYQRSIIKLNMIGTTEKNEDGAIIYKLPNNIAGNEIDPEYRTSQKDDIIININTLLNKLKGFLVNE